MAEADATGQVRASSRRLLPLALGAFAAIATAFFVQSSLADREAALEHGWTHAESAAALLAGQADRALRVAQVTTRHIAEVAAREGIEALAGPRRSELVALDLGAPELGALWVIGADGSVVASSAFEVPPATDASDRDYFRALRDGAPWHLSGLAVGRATGVAFFAWSHPIRMEGRFGGLVQAKLHAEDFAWLRDGLAPGPAAVLRLLRRDGVLLMRTPLAGPPDPPWPQAAAAQGRRMETGVDGVPRLVAWHAAPGMPVLAEVALSRDDVLAPFHQRLQRNGAFFGLALLLAGLLGAAALRADRRGAAAREAAEQRGGELAAALAGRAALLASIRESEARLRLAEQAGGIGLWDWDLRETRLLLAGEVFRGFGVPDAAPRHFRPLPLRAALRAIHPEDRARLAAAVARALRRGATLEAEFRLARAQPERWIAVRAEPLPDAQGRPRRLLGIARDVTDERQHAQDLAEANLILERRVAQRTGALAEANARLRESEARFRGIFNATFGFIGLLSPDGTVLEANEAMLRLAGAAPAGVVGRPYWEAPWWPEDPATRAEVRAAVLEAAAGRFVRREAAMRDAEGRALAVDFSVNPVRDEEGLVSLLVWEARDISDLKSAQALLLEAQKMDTLGQLTGGVAHDFNNLLMAVLGHLGVARRRAEKQAPDLLRPLDNATMAAERGAVLTQRLLAFARRQDLRPAPVDLAALLAGMDALLRRSAGPLAELVVEAADGLPPALVDPHALELAVMNLVVNARDAMPQGGRIAVTLRLAAGEPPPGLAPGRWLALDVRDSGEGMDAVTLARAVEPFFSTKAPGQGTGLGLSMVHGLAAQSGGALVLDSAKGRGTTATIWLPVSAGTPASVVPRSERAPPRAEGATVLVVDDEPLVLQSTAAMLEELGYTPLPAESGEAALELIGQHGEIRAVLTDLAMPGMTGVALAERIAALRPGLRIVLATGHAGFPLGAASALPLLAKPYSLAQLAEALGEVG
jgi:PAS domain S-box-containing protein